MANRGVQRRRKRCCKWFRKRRGDQRMGRKTGKAPGLLHIAWLNIAGLCW